MLGGMGADSQPFSLPQVDGECCQLLWALPGLDLDYISNHHVVEFTVYGLHLMYDWGSQVHLIVPSTSHSRLVELYVAFGGDIDSFDLHLDTRS